MTGVHPNVTSRINTQPYHINAVTDLLIRKIMTCRYTGNNAQIFLRRCVTDIILNFAGQQTDSLQPFLFSSMVHAATLNNIFSFLADHPHKFHSLPELAYMYDLPLEDLHHGFRQHFAIGIPDYMHMLKMMMIWQLVQTNSFPIIDVVSVTGYKSQEDMLADLTDYYGTLPE
jgi:transcriptional regulator GlxA family with amidase domain